MPGGDGTGPYGTGPVGWGRGPCGLGSRRARAFGFRFWQRPVQQLTLTKDEQKKILEAELKDIEAEKQAVSKRLKELE